MKVVSERSQEEIDAHNAVEDVGWCMRELAANLLRVIRGAGKPYEIEAQARELAIAFGVHRQLTGYGIQSDVLARELDTNCLRARFRPRTQDTVATRPDGFEDATARIVAGALQITASKLLDQLTHESRGESELVEGVRELERFWGR